MCVSRGDRTPPPLENHKNIGFLSNIGPDTLKTKPAFNVGPSVFRWRADNGPFYWYFDQIKNVRVGKTFWIRTCKRPAYFLDPEGRDDNFYPFMAYLEPW